MKARKNFLLKLKKHKKINNFINYVLLNLNLFQNKKMKGISIKYNKLKHVWMNFKVNSTNFHKILTVKAENLRTRKLSK
jgi:hypothetical protein